MPSAPKFAIGVEPKQAIEFLRQKKMLASKVLVKEMHDSALARATTIARLTSLDMTKDIYQSLETAMREGEGFHLLFSSCHIIYLFYNDCKRKRAG